MFSRRKIGILGGTFNPPHYGHLHIAQAVYEALQLDEVRFMPAATPPHKQKDESVTNENRFEMVRRAVQPYENFHPFSFEIERGGTSYTYDTMRLLTEREPDVDFYFIIGGDMIDSLSTWYKIDELMKMVRFVGVYRPGTNSQTNEPIEYVEAEPMDVASSVIRQYIREGKPVLQWVPETVYRYIEEEHLYENR